MSFTIHQATRERVKALVGFYSRSGAGKTHSALLMMRGLVGPKGKIAGVDTESGRMSIFADIIPGGYSVIDLEPPFTPERYGEALEVAAQNADGVVIDSFSHEWAGEGGILDQHESELERMAGSDWKKREACKMTAWIRPKQAHKRLVERILRIPKPVIVCLRGEEKTHIEKGNGKTEVYTDKFCSPIGDPRFIFEMLIHAECIAKENDQGHMVGGYLRLTKVSRTEIIPLLPSPTEQVGIKHGEALAQWCAGTPTSSPLVGLNKPATKEIHDKPAGADNASAGISTNVAALKRKLWDMTGAYHLGSKAKLAQFLSDEMFLLEDQALESLTADQLSSLITSVGDWIAKGHNA